MHSCSVKTNCKCSFSVPCYDVIFIQGNCDFGVKVKWISMLNPKVNSPPFAAAAAAGPLLYYQVDPIHQPLGFVYIPRIAVE